MNPLAAIIASLVIVGLVLDIIKTKNELDVIKRANNELNKRGFKK